jgi:hypothetical protein
MTVNPLLAIALALAGALVATIAALIYTNRRSERRIALLSRQRPACAGQPQRDPAPRHTLPPAAPGLRLSAADVARPLPKQLRHGSMHLVVLERVRRPRHNN